MKLVFEGRLGELGYPFAQGVEQGGALEIPFKSTLKAHWIVT